MKVEFASDSPVTDAACKNASGKSLKQWFSEIDSRDDLKTRRREAIQWMYDSIGTKDVWWPTTIWVEYERMHGIVNKKDGFIEGFNICVTKSIAVPPSDVFKAWTDSRSLRRWFGDSAKAKVADGSSFDDGDGHTGEFLRVRSDKDLRFSWIDPTAQAATLVDVVFQDKGNGKAGLMLNHQRIQNRPEADGLRKSWGGAFNALKSLLEA